MLDPLSTRDPDELVRSCQPVAAKVASRIARWSAPEETVREALDAGLAVLDDVRDEDLATVAAWRPPAAERANSVYLDSTTVVTVERLLAGERTWLTPLTLWDLSAVAERVVTADRVYYTGDHLAPAAALNERLGETVFVPVTPLSLSDTGTPANLYARNLKRYDNLWTPAPEGSYRADAVHRVTETWSLLTGRDLTPEHALVPREARRWHSDRPQVLTDPYCDDLPLAAGTDSQPVLGDITYRAYASQTFANLLGVPYAPATARMPFRYYFCERSWELDDRLRTGEAATEAYRQLAGETHLVLPVFLAVALARASSPTEIWTHLADLRRAAKGFRRHRTELDEALSLGQVSPTSRRLLSAVQSEALRLTDLLGFGYELVTQVVGRLTRATPPQLPDDVATLQGIVRSTLPADVRQRLWWWFFKPELRFLTHLHTQSRQMTNALPRIGRLWGLPPTQATRFHTRFDQLAELRMVG
ncbi:hypothetical protein BLA60_07805 [Actinophytocola xinjiangensis]|uniref:Uncharacterized protein n=1 Tax=Actinophytocola xinjiangensis TaxID=485602 RepID=A0A7Z0WQK9_9PSEU|nr:hypothetical protein [Actinophytocola xinjiangensis]OLF13123.1 hypothetical protein BLA60_07805 [Actinophytocola xinjiangensis]